MKQVDIARDCRIAPVTLNRIIQVLSERGYLFRTRGPELLWLKCTDHPDSDVRMGAEGRMSLRRFAIAVTRPDGEFLHRVSIADKVRSDDDETEIIKRNGGRYVKSR